ncbi:Formamidopyrimidine-DNA glycosylase [Orobanche gracilis]
MPELPEVEAARRALEDHCVGKKIKKSTVADDPKVIDGVSSKDFEAALVGKTIIAASRKGKNMWLELDSPPFPSFQFGMAGAVYIKGVAITNYKRSAVKDTDEWPSKYSKLFVEVRMHSLIDAVTLPVLLEDGLEFSFTDKRRFAKVRLLENPVSVPPISDLGPDALMEPMTVDKFYNSLSKKKIGIKALLLDQSFMSGIGNWMADEVLYQARIHPLQTASSVSKESCGTLLKCINEVTNIAVRVDADSLRFPVEWLFHFRWGQKSGRVIEKAMEVGADSSQFPSNWIFPSREKNKNGKAFVDGVALDPSSTPFWKKIEFINAGGRTTAYVPELQKLIGNQAVKGAAATTSKRSKENSDDDDGSAGDENEPKKPKVVKGKKISRAKKAGPLKKKSIPSGDDVSDDDNDDADDSKDASDLSLKRKKAAKNPPTKSETKVRNANEGEGQKRRARGKTDPAKKKHEDSDNELSNSSSSDDVDQAEEKEAEEMRNAKQVKAAASSNRNGKSKKSKVM